MTRSTGLCPWLHYAAAIAAERRYFKRAKQLWRVRQVAIIKPKQEARRLPRENRRHPGSTHWLPEPASVVVHYRDPLPLHTPKSSMPTAGARRVFQ
jgi:hypothetical protein